MWEVYAFFRRLSRVFSTTKRGFLTDQLTEPEQEKAHHMLCICLSGRWEMIWDSSGPWPNRTQHEITTYVKGRALVVSLFFLYPRTKVFLTVSSGTNSLSSNPALDGVPDNGQDNTI